MAVPECSRRTLFTGIALMTAVGLGGCLQENSRYQISVENSSSTSRAGDITLLTEREDTITSTAFDLGAGESTSLLVSTIPYKTRIDLDSRSGRSNFVWETPSCTLGGVPTQTIRFEGDTTGVQYGCKPSQE